MEECEKGDECLEFRLVNERISFPGIKVILRFFDRLLLASDSAGIVFLTKAVFDLSRRLLRLNTRMLSCLVNRFLAMPAMLRPGWDLAKPSRFVLGASKSSSSRLLAYSLAVRHAREITS